MNKTYINMFCLYSAFKNRLKNNQNISDANLTILEKNLKHFFNSDDSDGSDGDSVSEVTLDDSIKMNNELINILIHNIKNCKNKTQKNKLIKLINSLKQYLKEAIKNIEENTTPLRISNEQKSKFVSEYGDEKPNLTDLIKKFEEYSLFGLNKSLNPKFTPTTKPIVDTSKFDSLTREELVSLFDSKNFTKLTQAQQLQLLQATANEFLSSCGAPTCAVLIEDLPFSPNHAVFGEYLPNSGAIIINKNMFKTNPNNPYWPYKILETLIHESRHRWQFSTLDQPTTEKEKAIHSAIVSPTAYNDFSEYLTSYEELDSRNCALEYIRNVANSLNNDSLKAFYNLKLTYEQNSCKKRIPKEAEAFFPDVYNGQELNTCAFMHKALTLIRTNNNEEMQP